MDNLSSSLSLTGTTTYTQQSVSTFHQDVPRQTYTTAGTIYNPKNSQPLQPPVRRGRTLKWPPPGGPASELALFPKSVLANLPMKAQSICNTPTSPLFNQVPRYSPLQQNYDRAVSPVTDHSRHSLNGQDIRNVSISRMSSLNMNDEPASPVAATMTTAVMDKQVDAEISSEEDDESFGENPLKGLTVKSLHNLASYPNPNQKRAQRALLRARPGATPAPSTETNGSRTATPVLCGIPFLGDASGIGQDGSHSPGMFRSAKTDPADILKLQAESKAARDLSGIWRAGTNGVATPPSPFTIYNTQRNSQAGGYKSTLATGPGAPLPLTAGPPGQRQYRASTFETTLKALQNGPKANISSGEPVAADKRAGCPIVNQSVPQDLPRLSGTATPDHLNANLPMLLCDSTPDEDTWTKAADLRATTPALFETLLDAVKQRTDEQTHRIATGLGTAMEGKQGYPYGSSNPGNLGRYKNDVQESHIHRIRTDLKPGTWKIADEVLERRNERISRLFYAGTGQLGRSLESVTRDAEFRQFKRQVGVIGEGRPKPKPEKVEYPPISAQMVNNMTDKEVSEPFVTMTLSALLNHVEAGINGDGFHQWKDPELSLVEGPNKGRQSVFGN